MFRHLSWMDVRRQKGPGCGGGCCLSDLLNPTSWCALRECTNACGCRVLCVLACCVCLCALCLCVCAMCNIYICMWCNLSMCCRTAASRVTPRRPCAQSLSSTASPSHCQPTKTSCCVMWSQPGRTTSSQGWRCVICYGGGAKGALCWVQMCWAGFASCVAVYWCFSTVACLASMLADPVVPLDFAHVFTYCCVYVLVAAAPLLTQLLPSPLLLRAHTTSHYTTGCRPC